MKKYIIFCLLFFSFLFITESKASANYGIIQDGRTLVPVRTVIESFNVNVDYDKKEKSISINNQYKLFIGSKMIRKDGQIIKEMDIMPKLINGVTYVPVRDVADILGTSIHWNQTKKQIEYNVNGKNYTLSAYSESVVSKPKVSYKPQKISTNGKVHNVNVVHINLLAPNTTMHVELANNKLHSVSPLATIAKSHNAKAAINGNFFDAYAGSNQVYNAVVMNGQLKNWSLGTYSLFYYTKDGKAGIVDGNQFMNLYNQGNIQEALELGPRLVVNGQIKVNFNGFRDQKILTSSAQRSAVGVLPNNQVIFITTNRATIRELASIMKQLGAVDAMNFDGGASSGLYYNGKYITTPGRNIAVALLVK